MGVVQGNDGGFEHVAGQEVADGGRIFEGVADVADGADGKGAAPSVSDTEYCFAEHEKRFEDGRGREDKVLKWCLFGRDCISGGIFVDSKGNGNVSSAKFKRKGEKSLWYLTLRINYSKNRRYCSVCDLPQYTF